MLLHTSIKSCTFAARKKERFFEAKTAIFSRSLM